MASENFKRKLVAVLSADVEGYSRLMGQDDDKTVRTLKAYRELIFNLVRHYNGRVVDSPGDNILSEFTSIVDAVRCAVDIQKTLKSENEALPVHRRMVFRIGINLGDVIEDEGRIYGDGINIAARLEQLSTGGGICISRGAFEQVKNKLSLAYEDLGAHRVKNIAEPIRVYRIITDSTGSAKASSVRSFRRKVDRRTVAIGAVLILGIAALAFYQWYVRITPSLRPSPSRDQAPIALNDKPSIAVLPFKNLSGSPEQEYFSDGITNDIITDLSKFRELYVIASNTSFAYKDKPTGIGDIHRALGVRYILEGSVQKTGEKVRIDVQLVDATADHHLWAERYDRDFKNIFELQSEVVQSIVARLAIRIDESERDRIMQKSPDNLEAYDYLLRGWEYTYHNTREGNLAAQRMFERAIDVDPRYSSAYAALAWSHLFDFLYGWTMFPKKSLQRAYDLAMQALNLEAASALAHSALGTIYLRRKQYDLAVSELKQAIELNPNDTRSQSELGTVMLYSDKRDRAIYWLNSAIRLNPHISFGYFMILGQAYYLNERYEDAIAILNRGVARNPDYAGNYIMLAAANAQAGHAREARRSAREVLRLDPFFDVGSYGTVFRNPDDRSRIIDGLRKAGLS